VSATEPTKAGTSFSIAPQTGHDGGHPHTPGAKPPSAAPAGPIALDGLAYGIDLLDALLVFHLGDAHVHALWVRPDGGVRAEDVVTTLRDAYRVGQFASKRLAGASSPRAEVPAPLITLELPQRTALLRRIRAYVVACIFDAAMPLGMSRLIAARLAAALEPELPLGQEATDAASKARVVVPVPVAGAPSVSVRAAEDASPHTLTFGSALPRRSRPPPPPAELDRVSRLLAHLEAHAPDPHVVRNRLALRAGLTLSALERPEALGPEAIVLIETAVQDILGIDRAELRRIA
jgi:hypothetical protein